jgi:hypothetical protein
LESGGGNQFLHAGLSAFRAIGQRGVADFPQNLLLEAAESAAIFVNRHKHPPIQMTAYYILKRLQLSDA